MLISGYLLLSALVLFAMFLLLSTSMLLAMFLGFMILFPCLCVGMCVHALVMKSVQLTEDITMTSGWSIAAQDAVWRTPTTHTPASPAVLKSVATSGAAGDRREAAGLVADVCAAEPGREAFLGAILAARASLYHQ